MIDSKSRYISPDEIGIDAPKNICTEVAKCPALCCKNVGIPITPSERDRFPDADWAVGDYTQQEGAYFLLNNKRELMVHIVGPCPNLNPNNGCNLVNHEEDRRPRACSRGTTLGGPLCTSKRIDANLKPVDSNGEPKQSRIVLYNAALLNVFRR